MSLLACRAGRSVTPDGRFSIGAAIGEGKEGTVYEGEEIVMTGTHCVAIKVVHGYTSESRVLGTLRHENVRVLAALLLLLLL
jgi:hypothetical protein